MSRRKKRSPYAKGEHLARSFKSQSSITLMHNHDNFCPTGKIVHPSKATARRHAKSLAGSRGDPDLQAYACRLCGHWHVGHPRVQ